MSQTPSPYISNFPFENVEGNLFTPVCLKTHWDPTQMLRHILPQQKVGLPQDFRPWVKVCKTYVTSGPVVASPMPPNNMVFPMGGEFYPPGRYAENIDEESILRILDRPLDKWCPTQYIPKRTSNMYMSGSTVPDRTSTSAFVSELSMPQALLRPDMNTCRSKNDTKNFDRSARLFNNPTKQDRYGAEKFYALPGTVRGEPMPHGGVNEVSPTKQAKTSEWTIQQPLGFSYGAFQPPGFYNRGAFKQPGALQPVALQHLLPQKVKAFGATTSPGNETPSQQQGIQPPGKGPTSFVGTTTAGLAAPIW